jgi:hypothetical protein
MLSLLLCGRRIVAAAETSFFHALLADMQGLTLRIIL